MRFNFNNPVQYIFGSGTLETIGIQALKIGRKALIVTYPDIHFKNLSLRVSRLLSHENVESILFNKVMQNPLSDIVAEGSLVARENGCDMVIGLGGGSAMDTAKGIAAMAVNEGDIYDYIFGKQLTGALPIIAVTTTAGTGSEGNCTAVFTDSITHNKKGLVNPLIYPTVSIIDSELLATLPKRVIAGPGADTLFHAIESFISVKSNPISEMLSLKAMELLYPNLPRVYETPSDLDSWEKVALANTLAGMAIGSAGTTLPHALAHPLGGLLDIVHSEGLAAIYLPFMEFTYRSAPEKFAQIAKALGADIRGLNDLEAARLAIEMVDKLLIELDMKKSLSSLGVKPEHIDWLTNNALTTMNVVLNNNPIVPDAEMIREIFRSAL